VRECPTRSVIANGRTDEEERRKKKRVGGKGKEPPLTHYDYLILPLPERPRGGIKEGPLWKKGVRLPQKGLPKCPCHSGFSGRAIRERRGKKATKRKKREADPGGGDRTPRWL